MENRLLKNLKQDYLSGKSLNKLCKKYNLPKSTIYYNLSKFKIIRKVKIIKKLKSEDEALMGTFIGIWAGDGSKFRDRGRYVTKIHLHKENSKLIYFVSKIVNRLFDKSPCLYLDGGNRASLKFYNKFIHEFIEKYLGVAGNKCLTISLKNNISEYSNDFLNGFLLGLTLSDGSIRKAIYVYSTISNHLKENVMELLIKKGFHPKLYTHRRDKYGWFDLNQIRLGKNSTRELISELDRTISYLGFKEKLEDLKTK